ncbi:hypothetical protein [Falsarthrobacter nasiphocae]|uniref:Uncharacterized protein n=1 Tax=Falsarthrobacter nasiphocae TaxID=189863 RepID=A0AAE3YCR5_9MICC|nr:hypothetical protein [Falsarthrobacter nasiphocae]MDR6891498.1 hypothetical protein [Falsarthrobacter nasiphocae]
MTTPAVPSRLLRELLKRHATRTQAAEAIRLLRAPAAERAAAGLPEDPKTREIADHVAPGDPRGRYKASAASGAGLALALVWLVYAIVQQNSGELPSPDDVPRSPAGLIVRWLPAMVLAWGGWLLDRFRMTSKAKAAYGSLL